MITEAFRRTRTSSKRLLAAIHDVVMACVALAVSIAARYGIDFLYTDPRIFTWLASFALCCALVFYMHGLGRGIWRFASLVDLKTICIASATAIFVFLIAMFLLNRLDGLPRSLPIIVWINMVFFIGAPRLLYRALKDGWMHVSSALPESKTGAENILLVGAAADADQAIRTFMLENSRRYRVLGIVETRSGKVGRDVRGIPIIGDIHEFEAVVMRLRQSGLSIAAAVLVTPKADKNVLQQIASQAAHIGMAIRRVPAPRLGSAEPQLEAVTLEDLLGRPAVSLDLAGIHTLLNGKCVLVTGAGGSIGSEIVRQVATHAPSRIILFDQSEYNLYAIDGEMARLFPDIPREAILGDVRSAPAIKRLMMHWRPSVVFHAAALKHVPLVEINSCEGVLTNVIGTQNVADAAIESGANIFVMISSDKAIRPASVMGATKRLSEMYCQALDSGNEHTRFITVRFGNVLGSTGSVVPLFKQQISEGGPITVTDKDMQRYFMVVSEAVELVLQAAVAAFARPDDRGNVFVLDMGDPIKIVDLARTMIALSGLRPDVDIPIVFTGLRPGERLFEAIFDEQEQTLPSGKDGVFMARAAIKDLDVLRRAIVRIERAAQDGDEDLVRSLLQMIVPTLTLASTDVTDGLKIVPFQRH